MVAGIGGVVYGGVNPRRKIGTATQHVYDGTKLLIVCVHFYKMGLLDQSLHKRLILTSSKVIGIFGTSCNRQASE